MMARSVGHHLCMLRLFRSTLTAGSSLQLSASPLHQTDTNRAHRARTLVRPVSSSADGAGKKLHSRLVDSAREQLDEASLKGSVRKLGADDTFGAYASRRRPRRKARTDDRVTDKGPGDKTTPSTAHTQSGADSGGGITAERADGPAQWADVFGTLSPEDKASEDTETARYRDDEGEVDESETPYIRLSAEGRDHAPAWYGRQIEKLAKRGKINEAIAMLETKMIKEDRVLPNQFVFTTLIGCLGRVGYSHKAFKLFNKMKKFGLQPEDPTYTALFNACGNSPWRDDGLRRARQLRDQLAERHYEPNLTTYKAMVKAYGVCGDLQGAFALVDDVVDAGHRLDAELFSFLLMACISDREAGFKHAVEVWRQMRKRRVVPTIHQYNLLLRAVRDCAAGSGDFAQQLIKQVPPAAADTQLLAAPRDKPAPPSSERGSAGRVMTVEPLCDEAIRQVESPVRDGVAAGRQAAALVGSQGDATAVTQVAALTTTQRGVGAVAQAAAPGAWGGVSALDMDVPNMLSPRVRFRAVVGVGDLSTPAARLAFLGGLPGVLSHMARDAAPPDVKTFTLMLDALPATRDAEADLLAAMTTHDVTPDVTLLNSVIRRRNKRGDHDGAQEVLGIMSALTLEPNIKTYGCLAMGCNTQNKGLKLIADIEEDGHEVTVDIFSILVYQSRLDFRYKRRLCAEMRRLHLGPNDNILRRIEASVSAVKRALVDQERGRPTSIEVSETTRRDFKHFMLYYKQWLLSTEYQPKEHPWAAFRAPPGDTEQSATQEQ